MFSNLHYLANLIEKNSYLTKKDKIVLFQYASQNPDYIIDFIKSFEEAERGEEYIQKTYDKKILELGKNYYEEILKQKEIEENNNYKKIQNYIKDIRSKEKAEEENFNLNI